jgi:hypothetical protein
VDDLERRLKIADQLSSELETVKDGHRIYKQLADDLRSERFQAYLLEEGFHELVQGASLRLMEFSGRYTLTTATRPSMYSTTTTPRNSEARIH